MSAQPVAEPGGGKISILGFAGDVVLDEVPASLEYGAEVVIVLTARITDVSTRDAFVPGNPARQRVQATVTDVNIIDGDDVKTSGLTELETLREHSRRYVEAIAEQAIVDQVAADADRLAQRAIAAGRRVRFPRQRRS